MKFVILCLFIIVILAVSMAIGASNNQIVSFNYLIAQTELRLSTLLAILFGSGFIVAWLLTSILFLKVKMNLASSKRKLTKLQKKYDEEVANHQKLQLTKTQ